MADHNLDNQKEDGSSSDTQSTRGEPGTPRAPTPDAPCQSSRNPSVHQPSPTRERPLEPQNRPTRHDLRKRFLNAPLTRRIASHLRKEQNECGTTIERREAVEATLKGLGAAPTLDPEKLLSRKRKRSSTDALEAELNVLEVAAKVSRSCREDMNNASTQSAAFPVQKIELVVTRASRAQSEGASEAEDKKEPKDDTNTESPKD